MKARVVLAISLSGMVALGLLALVLGALPSPASQAAPSADQQAAPLAVSASRVFTLADGRTSYRLPGVYTTTIGSLVFVAQRPDRVWDEYGRILPYHAGFHYVTVSPTTQISPTGRWDQVYAVISWDVTQTVTNAHWAGSPITPTSWITELNWAGETISNPVWPLNQYGAISGTISTTMVLTESNISAPVAGAISVTHYISQSGHIVSGTISALLWMVFELPDSATGLTLNYQGLTGTLRIANEQSRVFYSSAADVGNYGWVQFQVQADLPSGLTNTVVGWLPQFAPRPDAGGCLAATAWTDAALSEEALAKLGVVRDPIAGAVVAGPIEMPGETRGLWVLSSGKQPQGFEINVADDCTRVMFEIEPYDTVFTPTIWLRGVNP